MDASPQQPTPGRRVALWLRVSTDEQHSENQERQLVQMAGQRNWEVVRVYRLDGASAYKGEHRGTLDGALAAAHRGEFDVLLVWALDRLDRESPTGPFDLLRRFKAAGCEVVSLTEPWASTDGPFADLLALLVGWFANFESKRKSERIKAGLARRKAQGGHVGRKTGAKDKGKRKRSGYFRRWESAGSL
jgi:DNA invertase Pin-like site-specific DNA recombinase